MKLLKILILIILVIPITVEALDFNEVELYSKYALVYDLTEDKYLLEKDINNKTPIASLTKMLTSITAIELIDNMDEEVTITNEMIRGIHQNASKAGLEVGDKVTYLDLLYASLLPSGADATQSLAISLKGSVKSFIEEMNKMANKIGMENSNFLNTSGLDITGQYSNASDTLKLFKYALDNEIFRQVFTTREYTLQNGLEVKSTMVGYQEQTKIDTSFIKGSKTGYTDYAGMCLASLMEYKNHEILVITINAPYERGKVYNLEDHFKIWNYMNNNYLLEEEKPNIDIEINENKETNKNEVIIKINKKYQTLLIIGGMVVVVGLLLGVVKKTL